MRRATVARDGRGDENLKWEDVHGRELRGIVSSPAQGLVLLAGPLPVTFVVATQGVMTNASREETMTWRMHLNSEIFSKASCFRKLKNIL